MQNKFAKIQVEKFGEPLILPIQDTIKTLVDSEKSVFVEGFAKYLVEDGKRPKTVESYIGDTEGFLLYLREKEVTFEGELKRFQITSYRNYLLENGYEVSTVNKKINSLQSFNHWLVEEGLTTEIVVDLRKDKVKIAGGSEKQVEVLPDKVVDKLLFFVEGNKVSRRDKTIILTLLYTGVRVSELCDIKLKNIDQLTGQLKVVGKGGKVREVPLRLGVQDAIQEYLADRASSKYSNSEYLFLGQRGVLQRDAVNTLLEKITDKARLEVRLKPHTFRHTFCTLLVSKGVPLPTVAKLAGHSSVDTTAHFYINSSREDKMKAVNLL
jgi:integrase/recombinase XerD